MGDYWRISDDHRPLGTMFITGSARCRNSECQNVIAFKALADERALQNATNSLEYVNDYDVTEILGNMQIYPEPPAPDIPDYLPDLIKELFEEAEDARLRGKKGARQAVHSYRSVLDEMLPEMAKQAGIEEEGDVGHSGKRYQLIQRLCEKGVLPPAIRKWIGSDGIRTMLTDASHANRDVTEEQARELGEITRFILIYVFTLPERIEAAKRRYEHDERGQ